MDFVSELRDLLNRQSRENESDTPDFILAEYMTNCLTAFERAVRDRDRWHGPQPTIKAVPETATAATG